MRIIDFINISTGYVKRGFSATQSTNLEDNCCKLNLLRCNPFKRSYRRQSIIIE